MFVAHSRIQLIRLLCVNVDTCVVVSEGKRSVFLITMIFFLPAACQHTFFVFWVHFKGTKNISGDSNASSKIKRVFYYALLLLFTTN